MNDSTHTMSLAETILSRRSWLGFGTDLVSVDEVIRIADLARFTPSEQNLQPWRLVVAQGEALERMIPALLGANVAKAREAGTLVVFAGDQGVIDDSAVASVFYETRCRRDFVFRNTALFLMTFMLAAQASGYVSRPLAGFDESALAAACGLADNEIPVAVMLLAPSPTTDHPEPQPARRPASSFVRILR